MKKETESSNKKMGKVIPLFRNDEDIANDFPELETIKLNINDNNEDKRLGEPTLYELVEEHLEQAQVYQSEEGQVLVVPVDDMDACIEEIIDASARLAAYEKVLVQISERPSDICSKIAQNVLKKHKWTP